MGLAYESLDALGRPPVPRRQRRSLLTILLGDSLEGARSPDFADAPKDEVQRTSGTRSREPFRSPHRPGTVDPVVRIGVTGRIVSGEDHGRYVRVEEDPAGYIVIASPSRDFQHGDEGVYDDWVATQADLAELWASRRWVVEWLD